MIPGMANLADSMLAGDKNALARLISLVEDDSPDLAEIMATVRPHLGKAHCIGITGPPGAGKSTLIDKLIGTIRSKGLSVGIVTVDPTSPVSGGAVLGDRIRMQQHYLDSEVFIRSMATRGSHGGLAKAVGSTVNLLDAFGKDVIIVETVGVGQTDLDITETADTTVLVLTPQSGDVIQIMKAGLIEVVDIIVVNKADLDGAERLLAALRTTLKPGRSGFEQKIVATQAVNGTGVEELYQVIDQRRQKL